VLASTSGVFPTGRLSVPPNAAVLDYLPHAADMTRAAVVVCHAGRIRQAVSRVIGDGSYGTRARAFARAAGDADGAARAAVEIEALARD
jgi:UDP:flavonoid glycosyltransferase YjiC (YdhE family)